MSKIEKFVSLVSRIENGQFVLVEKTSEHTMKKTGNPLRTSIVMKTSELLLQVGCDLQKIENETAKAELREAREIGPLPWGEHVEGLPIIKHKDVLYLRGFFFKDLGSSYTVNGIAANGDQLAIIANFSDSRPKANNAPLTIKLENVSRMISKSEDVSA